MKQVLRNTDDIKYTRDRFTKTKDHNSRDTSPDGQLKEVEELGVQVMETKKKELGAEHPSTLETMHNLASTYRNQGRWKEAEELDVQVIETRKRILGAEHPDTLTSMANLAHTWKCQGRHTEALKLMEECIKLRVQIIGVNHPYTLSSSTTLTMWRIEKLKISALAAEDLDSQ